MSYLIYLICLIWILYNLGQHFYIFFLFIAYLEPGFPAWQTLGDILLQFIEEAWQVNDDAIADERLRARPDDAAGQKVEVVSLVPEGNFKLDRYSI